MKAVRHLPVAEQYPSSTSTVSFFASKRISGMAISKKKQRRQKPQRCEVRRLVRSGGDSCSCGLFFPAIFDASPINIGTHFFAHNRTLCCALNGGAMLCRYLFLFMRPFVNGYRRKTKLPSKPRGVSMLEGCEFDQFHERKFSVTQKQ